MVPNHANILYTVLYIYYFFQKQILQYTDNRFLLLHWQCNKLFLIWIDITEMVDIWNVDFYMTWWVNDTTSPNMFGKKYEIIRSNYLYESLFSNYCNWIFYMKWLEVFQLMKRLRNLYLSKVDMFIDISCTSLWFNYSYYKHFVYRTVLTLYEHYDIV